MRELQRIANLNGIPFRITSGYRSRKVQWRLYRRWQMGLSPFPAAAPGTSKHELGLAFDAVADNNPQSAVQRELGELWESWGGRWGGRFRDPVHFELG